MSNYLQNLVEKMVADGVSEKDIASVIKEVNSKNSPLKQLDITPSTTLGGGTDDGVQTADLSTTQPTTVSQPSTTSTTSTAEDKCPEGYKKDERGVCQPVDLFEGETEQKLPPKDYSYLDNDPIFQDAINQASQFVLDYKDLFPEGEITTPTDETYIARQKSQDILSSIKDPKEREIFINKLADMNIVYNESKGVFEDYDPRNMLPEVPVEGDIITDPKDQVKAIADELGIQSKGVLDYLDNISEQVENVSIDGVKGSLIEDEYFQGYDFDPNDRAGYEEIWNRWSDKKKENYIKWKETGDLSLFNLEDIFTKEFLDNYLFLEKERIISNNFKKLQTSDLEDVTKQDLAIIKSIYDARKAGLKGKSAIAEIINEIQEEGRNDEYAILRNYYDKSIDLFKKIINLSDNQKKKRGVNVFSEEAMMVNFGVTKSEIEKADRITKNFLNNNGTGIKNFEEPVIYKQINGEEVAFVYFRNDKTGELVFLTVKKTRGILTVDNILQQIKNGYNLARGGIDGRQYVYFGRDGLLRIGGKGKKHDAGTTVFKGVRARLNELGGSDDILKMLDDIPFVEDPAKSGELIQNAIIEKQTLRILEIVLRQEGIKDFKRKYPVEFDLLLKNGIDLNNYSEYSLEKRTKDWEKNQQPVIDEMTKLQQELATSMLDKDSSAVDRSYIAGIISRMTEISDDFQEAISERQRLINLANDLDTDQKLLLEDKNNLDKNAPYYSSWSDNYDYWSKTFVNLGTMLTQILAATEAIGGDEIWGEVFTEKAREVMEVYSQNFPQASKWSDDVGFGLWFVDMLVSNSANGAALLTMLIPGAGPYITTAIFMSWTAGGKYTDVKTSRKNANVIIKKLESQLLDPNLSEGEKEFIQQQILVQKSILERSELGDRLVSITHGIITGIAERFGTLKVLKNWQKVQRKLGPGMKVKNLFRVGAFAGLNISIETFEEMLDQTAKNALAILTGETTPTGGQVGIFDGMDADFFANVVAFSTILQTNASLKPISLIIRESVLTSKEMALVEELANELEAITQELNENKKEGNLSKQDISALTQRKDNLLKQLSELENNIIGKLDNIKDDVDENGNIIKSKGQKIKEIFELAAKRKAKLLEAQRMGEQLDFDQKEIEQLEKEYEEIQSQIDAFFEANSEVNELMEEYEAEMIKRGINPVRRMQLLSAYQSALLIMKSTKTKGSKHIIKGLLPTPKEITEIKNRLEKQGFSKEKIDSELAELIKAASEGVSNGYRSEITGNYYIFNGLIQQKILLQTDILEASDAAAAPLHEIFHEYHVTKGLVLNGKLRKEHQKAVEELKGLMNKLAKQKKLTPEALAHFKKRIELYEKHIKSKSVRTEELMNIVHDIMFWGGLNPSDFNQLFNLRVFMNSLIKKFVPNFTPYINFNSPMDVYRYISKYHSQTKRNKIIFGDETDDIDITKHSLSPNEQIELTQIKNDIRDISLKIQKTLKEENLVPGTIEYNSRKEELQKENEDTLNEKRARRDELLNQETNKGMSQEERSLAITNAYNSYLRGEINEKTLNTKILKLMQPYITTVSKIWNFDAEKNNPEQAYKFVDFRRDIELEVIKYIRRYDPSFGQELSKYIMQNVKLQVGNIFEKAKLNVIKTEVKDDIKDNGGGDFGNEIQGVEATVDQLINSKLRKAFGITKDSDTYKLIFNKVKESLMSKVDALTLEDALQNPKQKKKFRQELEKEFTEAFRDVIKDIINPTNRRKTDPTLKKFLLGNKRLIIDLLAVKYKKRFPELSTHGGRMNTEKSIEEQTDIEGAFVESTSAGNDIWIKNYDIDDDVFVALFTEGRETRYNSLLDSLAAELGLDAVFDALPNELETITGKLVETIKRDPLMKFSLGDQFEIFGFEILLNQDYLKEVSAIARLIRKSSYEDVIDEDNLEVIGEEGKYSKESIATVIYANDKVAFETNEEVFFKKETIKWLEQNGFGDIANQFKSDGTIKDNGNVDKDGKGVLDRMFDAMEAVILELGYDAYLALGPDIFGFHYSAMDIGASKQGPKRSEGKFDKNNQSGSGETSKLVKGWRFRPETNDFIKVNDDGKFAKGTISVDPVRLNEGELVRGEFYERHQNLISRLKNIDSDLPSNLVVADIREMNSGSGLMKKIYTQVLAATDYDTGPDAPSIKEQKEERLERLFGDEIRNANEANIILLEHMTEKLVNLVKDGKISIVSALHLLQAQTNISKGFRALTTLDLITIENKVSTWFQKGEHIDPNGNKMFSLMKLMLESTKDPNINIKERVKELFSDHGQWLGPKVQMDLIDKLLGTNSTLGFERLKQLPDQVRKTIMHISGVEFDLKVDELIEQAQNKLALIESEVSREKREKRKQIINKHSIGSPYLGSTVLDFDLTVGESSNVVIATNPKTGETRDLDGVDWAKDGDRLLQEGWEMDFSDFDNVTDGKEGPVFPYLIKQLERYGPENVFILTARASGSQPNILAFINFRIDMYNEANGTNVPYLKAENVVGLGNSTGEAKADWIEENLIFNGFNDIVFIDDHIPNVEAVQKMFEMYPEGMFVDGGKSIVTRPDNKNSLGENFNVILSENANIPENQEFSRAQAQAHGKNKGRFQFIMNPSAMDFEQMLRVFIGKGAKGEKELEYLIKNLITPYARALSEIDRRKSETRELHDKIRSKVGKQKLKKLLKQEIGKTGFTNGDAVRVWLFNKNGHKDKLGLSPKELKELISTVENNPDLLFYAQGLDNITDGYVTPGKDWVVNTISGDLYFHMNSGVRAEVLKDWIEIKNEVFNEANLNKIEALYGSSFRKYLEEMLYKMENGKPKRSSEMGTLEKAWMEFLGGSTAVVMFANTRSAILQMLSSINYIELRGPNSLFNSARAFANVKQYWADVGFILMHPDMVARRGGRKIDVNISELVDYMSTIEGGVIAQSRAAVGWLLSKGFLMTQIADSLAISLGGAAYYRNYVNHFISQGYSKQEAEQMAWDKTWENTQATQQSIRPDKLSYEQASILGKFLLNFKVTPMQYTRKIVNAIDNIRNKRGTVTQNIKDILYYGAIQNLLFTGLQQAVFIALMDEDEDWETRSDSWIKSTIESILVGMGLEGVIVVTVVNGIIEYKEQESKGWNADHTYTILQFANISPVVGIKLRQIYSAIKTKQINKDVIEAMDWNDPMNPQLNVIANTVQAFTNIPANEVISRVQNLLTIVYNEAETEEEFEEMFWKELMIILGWNPWDVGLDTKVKKVREEVKEQKKEDKKEEKKLTKEEEIAKDVEIEKRSNPDAKYVRCSAATSDGDRCARNVKNHGDRCSVHGGQDGPTCGDNGGTNSKGLPCGNPVKNQDGRCNIPSHRVK